MRRLPPALRAALWLGAVAVIALALAVYANDYAMWDRITGAPDMWLAVLGSTATAVLATIAARTEPAGRAARLGLAAAGPLWLAASGFGCLRVWFLPQTHVAEFGEARDCLIFIVSLSVPLSALLFLMLRRACPLQPGLTAAIGGWRWRRRGDAT